MSNYIYKPICTPLHKICLGRADPLEILDALSEANINSQKSPHYDTPLHYVCSNANVSLPAIKAFIENGARVDITNIDGITAFNRLCRNKNSTVEQLEYFLKKGASVSRPNKSLEDLESKDFVKIRDEIWSKGGTISSADSRKDSPLLNICYYDPCVLKIKLLLKYGADIELQNLREDSPRKVLKRKGLYKKLRL